MNNCFKLYYFDSVAKRYLGFDGIYSKRYLKFARFNCYLRTGSLDFITIPFFNSHFSKRV